MSESIIPLLTFTSTTLLILSIGSWAYDHFFHYRITLRERLKGFAADSGPTPAASLFQNIQGQSNDGATQWAWNAWVQKRLEDSGWKQSTRTFVLLSLTVGTGAATVGAWWAPWVAAVLGTVGCTVPLLVSRWQKKVREQKLSRQLPEAFSMISRAVRAGQTVPSALQIIAQDFEPPISTEFARCYEQQNLGVSRESAFRQLAARTGIMELQIFVVALLVQARSGGNLVELLDNLSAMIRKRLKLKDRVRSLTGEGRMQAIVLTILPVAALVGILVVSPEYAACLFERPWVLAATAMAQAVGVLWIRRIVNFEF